MANTPLKSVTPPLHIWWIIWGGITAAFFVVLGIFENGGPGEAPSALSFLALAPLAASVVMRFVFLPRAEPAKKFPLFIVGLALAESGGLLALVFSSPWKTPLAAAAIVMMIVHLPAFIGRT
jgi:hypothetical protein